MLNLRRSLLTGQHQRFPWIAKWRNQKWINKLSTWALAPCPQAVNRPKGKRERGELAFSVVNTCPLSARPLSHLPCVGECVSLWRPYAWVEEGEAMNGGGPSHSPSVQGVAKGCFCTPSLSTGGLTILNNDKTGCKIDDRTCAEW